jgi:hypothetical protein
MRARTLKGIKRRSRGKGGGYVVGRAGEEDEKRRRKRKWDLKRRMERG